jgi:hypothetical protein
MNEMKTTTPLHLSSLSPKPLLKLSFVLLYILITAATQLAKAPSPGKSGNVTGSCHGSYKTSHSFLCYSEPRTARIPVPGARFRGLSLPPKFAATHAISACIAQHNQEAHEYIIALLLMSVAFF